MSDESVKELVMAMGDFDADEIEKYGFIISSAISGVVEMKKSDSNPDDIRLVQLAAAKAYYLICCLASQGNGVTRFSAGDVSITEAEGSMLNGAREIYECALGDCRGLICDNGFAFLGV